MQKDIIVVGGGMIGATCATGLAQLGLQIHVIEHHSLPEFDSTSDYDIRISAISAASVNLLKTLKAWQHIEKMRIFPIEDWKLGKLKVLQPNFTAKIYS